MHLNYHRFQRFHPACIRRALGPGGAALINTAEAVLWSGLPAREELNLLS